MSPHARSRNDRGAAEEVQRLLAHKLRDLARSIPTPFGVRLWEARGKFLIGEHVLTPGLDGCTPLVPAEVLAVGTRSDRDGVWCLLVGLREPAPFLLVGEDALRRLPD